MKYIIHTDGGARGNPGPAAVGVVIEKIDTVRSGKPETVAGFGKTIGQATNNVAEYTAVVEALNWLVNQKIAGAGEIDFYLDSTLVVNQLNGLYKVKESHLRQLLFHVREQEQQVGGVIRYFCIPRMQNQRADLLVNQALDGVV